MGASVEGRYAVEAWENVTVSYKLKDGLHDSDTPFQAMEFVDTVEYGKMLLLDGIVQTTERDEFVYHEMMTHVGMFSHENPESVLIIGGGDGGILREVLKHSSVKKAVMVEIDQKVIDFSKQHLSQISNGAFDSDKSEIVISDGAEYVKTAKKKFDVIIVDSPDPVGPAKVLFTKEFYEGVASCLTKGGVVTRQSGSSFMQPDELKENYKLLKSIFKFNSPYVYSVPTYIGGLFCSQFSSNSYNPGKISMEEISRKFEKFDFKTKYYNPGIHFGAFQLPEYIKEIIND
ncbi:MAG: polyamine aminopropyltransferase [Planctomycetota bacterium]|jgi:spermidine synthase